MASDKKVVLVFTNATGSELSAAPLPALSKLFSKGTFLSQVSGSGNPKTCAAAGATSGETLWDAAAKADFTVGTEFEKSDLCVFDAVDAAGGVDALLAPILEAANRSTLIVLIAADAVLFYGVGIAKGKILSEPMDFTCVAPTVAYVADLAVPAQCTAPVAYAVLKDINFKLQEVRRLQTSITNMEAAMEHKSRQPWDKHDCA